MSKGVFLSNLLAFAVGVFVTHLKVEYGIAAFVTALVLLGILATIMRVKASGAVGLVWGTEKAMQYKLSPVELAIGSSLVSLMAAPFFYMIFAFLFM